MPEAILASGALADPAATPPVTEPPVTEPPAEPSSKPDEPVKIVPLQGWMTSLPDAYKENEVIGGYDTPAAFAQAFLDMKEKEGVPLLAEDATVEQETQLFRDLGMPEKASDYEIPKELFPEDMQTDELTERLGLIGHNANLTQHQMAKMAEGYADYIKEQATAYEEVRNNEAGETLKAVMKENNLASEEAAEPLLQTIRKTVVELFGDDGLAAIQKGRLENNLNIVRGIIKVIDMTKEDHLRTGEPVPKKEEQTAADKLYGKDPNMIQGDKEFIQPEVSEEDQAMYKKMYG